MSGRHRNEMQPTPSRSMPAEQHLRVRLMSKPLAGRLSPSRDGPIFSHQIPRRSSPVAEPMRVRKRETVNRCDTWDRVGDERYSVSRSSETASELCWRAGCRQFLGSTGVSSRPLARRRERANLSRSLSGLPRRLGRLETAVRSKARIREGGTPRWAARGHSVGSPAKQRKNKAGSPSRSALFSPDQREVALCAPA
ncbi:hypothetical protein ABIA24_004276 [Sinorhizobium fredii]